MKTLIAVGHNSMTGYGSGRGMRPEFSADADGWYLHEQVGCLDAPDRILSGAVVEMRSITDTMYQAGCQR